MPCAIIGYSQAELQRIKARVLGNLNEDTVENAPDREREKKKEKQQPNP